MGSVSTPDPSGARQRRRLVMRRVEFAVVVVCLSLGLVAAALPIYLIATGESLVFISTGSMSPTIEAGQCITIAPVAESDLAVGDVATYTPLGSDAYVTHRIAGLVELDGELFLQTKGDANEIHDPDLTPAGNVEGVMVRLVPNGSRWVSFYESGWGPLLVFGLPLLFVIAWSVMDLAKALRSSQQVPAARMDEADAAGDVQPARSRRVMTILAFFGVFAFLGALSAVVLASRSLYVDVAGPETRTVATGTLRLAVSNQSGSASLHDGETAQGVTSLTNTGTVPATTPSRPLSAATCPRRPSTSKCSAGTVSSDPVRPTH